MSVGIKYRHRKTGKIYRWLAAGIDMTPSRGVVPVAVYCPDDNEHSILVMDQAEFENNFEVTK